MDTAIIQYCFGLDRNKGKDKQRNSLQFHAAMFRYIFVLVIFFTLQQKNFILGVLKSMPLNQFDGERENSGCSLTTSTVKLFCENNTISGLTTFQMFNSFIDLVKSEFLNNWLDIVPGSKL